MKDLLDGAMPPISIDDQIACVEREISMRKRVYPRQVDQGRMTPAKASEEMRRMEAVLFTLRSIRPSPGI